MAAGHQDPQLYQFLNQSRDHLEAKNGVLRGTKFSKFFGMALDGFGRLCSTLDLHLSRNGGDFICGDEYTIADMIILPWYDVIRKKGYTHSNGVAARDFLNMAQYKHANAWADRLCARKEVQRGMLVCRGVGKPWLSEVPKYKSRFGYLRRTEVTRSKI